MTDWQPIETAPEMEAGDYLLLWNGYRMTVGYCVDEDYGWWEHYESIQPQPTHWAPLPEPPEATL